MLDEYVDRVFSKTTVADSGCWLFGGLLNAGYGLIKVRLRDGGPRKNLLVHRVAFTYARGPIPTKLVIDHVCRVRNCVNPWHLRTVTRGENVLAPGSLATCKAHADKTHCVHGHPFDAANTRHTYRGKRECLACRHDRNRRRTQARRLVRLGEP